MAEAAPPPRSPPRATRTRTILLALATLLLLLAGFSVTSSLAAAVSENRWWMLGLGLVVCVGLPALVASWIRSLRRGRREEARIRGPGTVGAVAVANLLFVLGGCLLAPAITAGQLRTHGAWWVESIVSLFGKDRDNRVVRGAERTFSCLAGLLGGDDGGTARPARGDGSVDGGVDMAVAQAASQPTAPPDGGGAPALPGEVRVTYQRRGATVIVPVTLHGPAGHLPVKMLFDTGASISTLDSHTLRRLGVLVAPGDPTIETHTAKGKARRIITVIEGVTLGAARISGGVTVALCEPCAMADVVGLLGLNVMRHFQVTLDDEAGQVVLRSRRAGDPQGDLADIRPFIKLRRPRGQWRGPMLTVRAELHNRAPRRLTYVKLAAVVADGAKVWGEVRDVPARGRVEVKLQGLLPVKGDRFELRLERADW